ncbi:prolyl endopeptidase-like isoform X7 [Falco peregrinus]|uniref:prolyl endopeptidase-like isoform X7 n=1 Tax=Falco peregrinus TaxID=8954 RepID=UPI00247AE36B|nr:prolyl endopeptidase-like isoform X7 [Falco peregrinus]
MGSVDYQEMKVRTSCVGLQNLLQRLSFSVKHYSKHNHLQTVCFYSKLKPKKCHILDCSGSTFTHWTVPPGTILPWRFFSCKQEGTKIPSKRKQDTSIATSELLYKNLLKLEQENWNVISARYNAMTKRIKEKLEELHKYEFCSGSPRIRFGQNVYFEENGCIFLSKADDADEGNVDILFSTKDLGFSDAFIQRIRISPDQRYMAISLKSENSEEATCVVMKLGHFPIMEEVIPSVFSFEWATNDVLYYTSQKNLKCQNVFMTTFTDQKHTKLVYTEQDARFFVDIYCTKDRRFLTINSNSKTTSEVWLVDCRHPFKLPALVQARTKGVIYHVEHRNDELYILTTYGEPAEYKLPTWACEFELESHPEHTTSTCYFQLTSPVHPPKRFAYSFKENNLIEQAVQEVPIIMNCHTTRLLAKSKDETLVPITVFHNMNSKELHRKPLLVHVYGAYGIDLNMSFKEEKLMLIEEGWILAYCHVRGGGELGLSWHKDGCQHNKLKGLHDLKACIMLLHELGFSQPKYTALVAASAGGVLAGALCNTDPELTRAMALQAPFVDVLNTMMKTHLPLTIEEQEEWGNPLADEKCMEYIKSYCPYQNIKPQCYPSVFITAYENDQRIPLAGVLRYVQKLRKAALDHASRTSKEGSWIPNIILDIQENGSHCDSSWEDSLNEVARRLAFLNKELEEVCHLEHHSKSCK